MHRRSGACQCNRRARERRRFSLKPVVAAANGDPYPRRSPRGQPPKGLSCCSFPSAVSSSLRPRNCRSGSHGGRRESPACRSRRPSFGNLLEILLARRHLASHPAIQTLRIHQRAHQPLLEAIEPARPFFANELTFLVRHRLRQEAQIEFDCRFSLILILTGVVKQRVAIRGRLLIYDTAPLLMILPRKPL